MLVADGPVPVFPTPVAHRGHCTGKTAFGRDLPDHVLAVPRPSPDMGQAEEVEAGPIRLRMACALCHLWAEIDEACDPDVQDSRIRFFTGEFRRDPASWMTGGDAGRGWTSADVSDTSRSPRPLHGQNGFWP